MMLFFLTKRCFWNITACWSFLNIYTCTFKALRVEDIYVYINTIFYREVAQRVEPGKRPGNLAVVRTNTGIIRHNRKTIQLFSLNLFLYQCFCQGINFVIILYFYKFRYVYCINCSGNVFQFFLASQQLSILFLV